MPRPLPRLLALALLGAVLCAPGCGPKAETQPDPQFKVPDIPPGRGSTPGAELKLPDVREKKL